MKVKLKGINCPNCGKKIEIDAEMNISTKDLEKAKIVDMSQEIIGFCKKCGTRVRIRDYIAEKKKSNPVNYVG